MTNEIDNVIRKIEALLNTRGCTEAEATARIEKAQELLERYNLDMASLGKKDGQTNHHRKDTRKSGGLYQWQRDLWASVAKLNFCHHIAIKGTGRGSKYEHRIVGSAVNVAATEAMGQYLQDTIERLAQAYAKERDYGSVFVREAIAFREGAATRVAERLEERRKDQVNRAEREKQATGATSNALTIMDVIGNEEDLNSDYINGYEPGTTAATRARNAAYMTEYWRKQAEAAEAQKYRDEATDREKGLELGTTAAERKRKEAKEWEERMQERRKREERNAKRRKGDGQRYRKATEQEKRAQLSSFDDGRDAGNGIGLDDQLKGGTNGPRITDGD